MELLKKIAKNGALLSSCLGVYYLFVFTSKEGIPFPLDMSVLPTILLALGMLCLLFTAIIALYSTISIIVITDPLDIKYDELLVSKPDWLRSKLAASVINYFLFFCFTPLLAIVLLLTEFEGVSFTVGLYLLLMPMLFSYYALTPNKRVSKEDLKYLKSVMFWKTVATFFYIGIFAFLSGFVFIKYTEFGLAGNASFFIAVGVFFLFSYIILIPPKKKDNYQSLAEKYTKKNFINELIKIPAFIVYLFGMIFSFIPSVSYSTASASFTFLNVGGGIERSYYYSKKAKMTIPPEIVGKCDEDFCITKKLKVVLDLGGTLFVRGNYFGGQNTLVALPRKFLYMINSKEIKEKSDERGGSS